MTTASSNIAFGAGGQGPPGPGATAGLFANRPAASAATNAFYVGTDNLSLSWSDGTQWYALGSTALTFVLPLLISAGVVSLQRDGTLTVSGGNLGVNTSVIASRAYADAGDAASVSTAEAFAASSIAAIPADGAAGTPSLRTLGTGAAQAVAGNDARLSNARTPTDASVTNAKLASGAVANDGASLQGDGTAGSPLAIRPLGVATSMLAAAAVTAVKLTAALFSSLAGAAPSLAGAAGTSTTAFAREDHAHPFPTGVGQTGQTTGYYGATNASNAQETLVAAGGTVTLSAVVTEHWIDASSASGTYNLPTAAAVGDKHVVFDYKRQFGTHPITVQDQGGGSVDGASTVTLSTPGAQRVFTKTAAGTWVQGS